MNQFNDIDAAFPPCRPISPIGALHSALCILHSAFPCPQSQIRQSGFRGYSRCCRALSRVVAVIRGQARSSAVKFLTKEQAFQFHTKSTTKTKGDQSMP